MTGYEFCEAYWWIFPLVMFLFCFLMMRGRGCASFCGSGTTGRDDFSESTKDILDKRYSLGEIDQEEYEKKKRTLTQT